MKIKNQLSNKEKYELILSALETFRLALRAAETGNLVFATLHTSGAARTVSRIIDMFPGDEKDKIRQQLSESLL